MEIHLDEELLLGSATAPYQIEGGSLNTDWNQWCQLVGKINDGSSGEIACDHWNRIEQDIALLKKMNQQVYRFGIEWARIQTSAGEFDDNALDRYRYEIELLRENGIKPLVTLHHFVNPLWVVEKGGWVNEEIVDRFIRYVRYVVDALADLVDEWVTINEPFVYLVQGYFYAKWPPGKTEPFTGFKVLRNMIQAHIKAYQVIHQIYQEKGLGVKVGIAHHMRVMDPLNPKSPLDRMSTKMANQFVNKLVLDAMLFGRLQYPLGSGQPWGEGPFCDYLGLNYYGRDLIKFSWNPKKFFIDIRTHSSNEKNDLGWEIYPEGLYRILKSLAQYDLPIYITENGIADAADDQRSKFILSHLHMIQKARNEGISVERYYHWSTMDNFEWAEGLSVRFGLVEVDYSTLERKIRPSGKMYAEICGSHLIKSEMIKKYAVELAE